MAYNNEILDTILSRLEGVKQTGQEQWQARCPCHDDRRASLSVSVGDRGQLIMHDHAGCQTEQIVSALGLKMSDLFPKRESKRIVAQYQYSNGAQKLRYECNGEKSFSWRQPDGRGGWIYNRKGLQNALYVAGSISSPVFIVEGEKDADNLHRLGFNAVCTEDGAKKNGKGWHSEYTEQLSGVESVYIIPDNDDIGREFAQTEAAALYGHAGAVYMLDLTTVWPDIKNKQDISDYLSAFGAEKTVAAVRSMVDSATPWAPGSSSGQQMTAQDPEASLREYREALQSENADSLIVRVNTAINEPDDLRAFHLAQIRNRAKEIGAGQEINKLIDTLERLRKKAAAQQSYESAVDADALGLSFGTNGKPLPTIENFTLIMAGDPFYSGVRFNLITNCAERDGRRWTDADEAASQQHIEKHYGIFSHEKHSAALRLLFKSKEINPLLELVDSIEWDGVERCAHFLSEWGSAEDTPYTREVSRLIFAGGIHRLYLPGCKFDDVPVLIGEQGSGKSTLVRWLALHDDFYAEATTISGPRAIEQLDGAWIVEFAELSAIKTEKSAEAVKAYITRQRDRYRKPYDRNVSELPRRCTFIGTTNTAQFLTDQTGGRRFYPVTVNSNGYQLHDHEPECREYIAKCWAEARVKYKSGQMPACADRTLIDDFRAAQDRAQEDDWRVGKIKQYLDRMPNDARVCILMIYREALVPDPDRPQNPTTKESRDIGKIMQGFTDWERCGVRSFDSYGSQKCWVRVRGGTDPDELPF